MLNLSAFLVRYWASQHRNKLWMRVRIIGDVSTQMVMAVNVTPKRLQGMKMEEDEWQKHTDYNVQCQAEKEEGTENIGKEGQRNRRTRKRVVCVSQERRRKRSMSKSQ